MGYELHITRAEEHYASDEHPIGLAEWLTYAASNPVLAEAGWIERTDGGRLPLYMYVCADGNEVSLTWFDGGVDIKGVPDEQAALELVALAADLQANLIGDDGERYTTAGVVPAG